MANKPKLLKSLLTTASAVTIIASSSTAYGDTLRSNNAGVASKFSVVADWINETAGGAARGPGAGDNIKFGQDRGIEVDVAGAFGTVDANGKTQGLTVSQAASFTGFIDSVVGGGGATSVTLGKGKSLSLSGDQANYKALGDVRLGQNSIINFNVDGLEVKSTINGSGAARGTVKANENMTFSGIIGGATRIDSFSVANNKNVVLKANLNTRGNTTIGENAMLAVDNKSKARAVGGFTLNNGATLNVEAEATAVTDGNFLLGDGATLNVKNKGVLNGVDIQTAAAGGVTTVNFLGIAQVNATIGNGKAITNLNFGNGSKVEISEKVVKVTNMTLGATSKFILTEDGTTITTEKVTGSGKFEVQDNLTFVAKQIGTADAPLGGFEFTTNDDKALELEASPAPAGTKSTLEINVDSFTTTQNGSAVNLQGDIVTINANFGTDAAPIYSIGLRSNQGGTAGGVFKFSKGKTAYLVDAGGFNLAADDFDNILELAGDIKGEVYTQNHKKGQLKIVDNAGVKAVVENGKRAVKLIEFAAADKTLTVQGVTILAHGILFDKHAIISCVANEDIDIAAKINIAADPEGKGVILANNAAAGKTLTITGDVGDVVNNKSLRLIQATGGANISLEGDMAIQKVDIGGQDATLTLVNDKSYFIGSFTHGADRGVLEIGGSVTLEAGSFAGDAALRDIRFTVANKTLTVEDGVKLASLNHFLPRSNGKNSLEFLGNAIIESAIGDNANRFKKIEVTGADKTVRFTKPIYLTGELVIADNATVVIAGGVSAQDIQGEGGDKGRLVFANPVPLTLDNTTKIGDGNVLESVEVRGADVTIEGEFKAPGTLAFTSANPTTLTIVDAAADFLINTIITNASSVGQNISLPRGEDQQFDRPVGTAAKPFGNFILNSDDEVKINTTQFYAGVVSAKTEEGQVEFLQDGSVSYDLGKDGTLLKSVTFAHSATVKGNVYTVDLDIVDDKIATFEKSVNSKNAINVGGTNASGVSLSNGAILNSDLTPRVASQAVFRATGNVEINGVIGKDNRFASVGFNGAADNVAMINNDIHSDKINFNSVQAKFGKDVTLDGVTTVTNIDIGSSILTLTNGNSSLAGASVLNVTLNADGSNGQVIVDGNAGKASLDLSKITSLFIDITDNTVPDENIYTIFSAKNKGTIIQIPNSIAVSVRGSNRFSEYQFINGQLKQKNITGKKLLEIVSVSDDEDLKNNVDAFDDLVKGSSAAEFISDLGRGLGSGELNEAKVEQALQRLIEKPQLSSVTKNVNSEASAAVGKRVFDVAIVPTVARAAPAAGDDDSSKYGVWINPFYGRAVQMQREGTAGYRADSGGGTIGADLKTARDLSLGVAFSYARTNVKHQDFKAGDKTNADTYIFSIYGIQALTDAWFLQGLVSYGTTAVKNKEIRITSKGNETANGNYDSTTLNGEMAFSYAHRFENLVFMPVFGVGLSRINDGGYRESGTTNQNLDISKKSVTRFEGMLGFRVQAEFIAGGVGLIPDFHVSGRYDFIGKNPTITAKLDGTSKAFVARTKSSKAMFNLGGGLSVQSGIYEYGVGYDLNMSSGYKAHQGSLKFRLMF